MVHRELLDGEVGVARVAAHPGAEVEVRVPLRPDDRRSGHQKTGGDQKTGPSHVPTRTDG